MNHTTLIRPRLGPSLRGLTHKNILNSVIENDHWNLHHLTGGQYSIKVSSQTYHGENNFFSKDIAIVNSVLEWDSELPPQYASIDPPLSINLKYLATEDSKVKFLLKAGTDKTFVPVNVSNKILNLDAFGKYCLKAQGDISAFLSDSAVYCFEYNSMPAFPDLPKASDQIMNYVKHKDQDAYLLKLPTIERAVKYIVTIYEDQEGTKNIFEGEANIPEIYWVSDYDGEFFFRYKVYDSRGRSSSFSPMSHLIFPISPNTNW